MLLKNRKLKRRGIRLYIFFFWMLLSHICFLASHFDGLASAAMPSTRVIVDRAGREVRIPANPRRVACIFGPSYEKCFALGAADRVAMAANVRLPWNFRLNPGLKQIPVIANYGAPNVEQLMALGVDLVIYHPFARQIEYMRAAGLPVVVAYDGSRRPATLDGFIADWYAQIRFYGEVLGGEAKTSADEYCRYVDKRLRPVIATTRKIPAAKRPRVFYVCGRIDGLSNTQSRFSTADWMVTAAGGRMLTHDEAAYFVTVTAEQLIAWNPEIIVVGTLPSVDAFGRDPRFVSLTAVKNKKVFITPEGQFYWSHFSSESFLGILFLAKLFHPDRFAHIDLTRELKSYYAAFYHYRLSDDEARRILNHLPPAQYSTSLRRSRQ